MSKFDVAVGLDEATLNQALAQLFGHAGFQEKVARGQRKVSTPMGEIEITWEIKSPPAVSFAAVPPERWRVAVKGLHDKQLPGDNVLTLVVPEIHAEIEYADGAREADTTEAHLYAQLRLAQGKLTVDPYGLWVDPAKLQNIQPSALNALAFFGLEMAEEALTDIALPAVPADLGVALGPYAACIDGPRLVVGASIAPGPVDLTGGAWPAGGLFALASHDLVNGLLRAQALPRLRGRTLTWRREALGSPGDGGAAVAEAAAEVLEVDVQVDGHELTQLGGTARLALRGSATLSLLKALGLGAVQRILDKLYLAWIGLGYGAQPVPSPVYVGVKLLLEDRAVKVQLLSVRRCAALVWPRGSLPTILLSLALWPVTLLAGLVVPPVLIARLNRQRPTYEVFSIPAPTVTFELLGKPLSLTVGSLSGATHEQRLLIQGAMELG